MIWYVDYLYPTRDIYPSILYYIHRVNTVLNITPGVILCHEIQYQPRETQYQPHATQNEVTQMTSQYSDATYFDVIIYKANPIKCLRFKQKYV